MADTAPKNGLAPMHPGELLREVTVPALQAAGTPASRLAQLLGLSRSRFYDLLHEKASVDAELALKLGKLMGNGPEIWLELQQRWDLARGREALAGELAALPTLAVPEPA